MSVDPTAIRDRLLEFVKMISPQDLIPALEPEASTLVAKNPFAFILAASLDRGVKAEIIWTIPYWIQNRLGHLDPHILGRMSLEEIRSILETLPNKPRYMRDAPRTILEISRLVCEDFQGDAEALWRSHTANEVKQVLKEIHGIGEGIASMTVLLLERCRGVRFQDRSIMDIKPDVHVQRVLFRLGMASARNEIKAIEAARALNPHYPGALDPPLWEIGRRWCKEKGPDCSECWMNKLCPKIGLKRRKGTFLDKD